MEGVMPGMAEQDIALKLTSSAARDLPDSLRRGNGTPGGRGLLTRRVVLCTLDVVSICVLGLITYALAGPSSRTEAAFALVLSTITVLVSISLWERGLYNARTLLGAEPRLRLLAMAWLQGVGLSLVVAYTLVSVNAAVLQSALVADVAAVLRGIWLPAFLASGFAGLVGVRLARSRWVKSAAPPSRTVVVGTTVVTEELLRHLRARSGHPLNVIGVVDHGSCDTAAIEPGRRVFCGLPILGRLDRLLELIRDDQVDTVLVAIPWAEAEAAQVVIRRLSMAPIDVYLVPGLDVADFTGRQASIVAGLPMLLASNRPLGEWQAVVKRAEDLVVASLMLLLAGPAMLGIALLVKCTSRGPVLFRQRRLGFNNRIIEVYKFRTMYADMADADARQQTLRGDKRVTTVGAWLRRSSLDELPQLLNVLQGDMSVVGPRPHALQTTAGGLPLEDAVPVYPSRHRVKPGITGWAQVNGYRGALDTVEKIVHRVNHDLYYIENWSLFFDIKILWRTARLMVIDDNAF